MKKVVVDIERDEEHYFIHFNDGSISEYNRDAEDEHISTIIAVCDLAFEWQGR